MQDLISGRAGNIYRDALHKTSMNNQKCFQYWSLNTKPKIAPLVQACEVTETGLSCVCRLLAMAVLATAGSAGRVNPAGAAEHSRPTKVQLV